MLGAPWKCCLCIYQFHQRVVEVGGWCLCESEGRGGGLLSEAHNLIIQSIEQHIHFIVLQISPNSLSSSEALRIEQSGFMFSKELPMRSPEWSVKSAVIAFFNALHCQVPWYDFSLKHYLSLAIQNDPRMIQTWERESGLTEIFGAVGLSWGRAERLRGNDMMMVKIMLGVVSEKSRATWWIIRGNVNWFHHTGNC